MAQFADNFDRSGNLAGSLTSTGAKSWRVVAGSFSTNGSAATRSGNPAIAVLDTDGLDGDMTIEAWGGTALYARVKDAANWIRARVNYSSYTQSGGYYRTVTRSGSGSRYYVENSPGNYSMASDGVPSNAYNVQYQGYTNGPDNDRSGSPDYYYTHYSYNYDEQEYVSTSYEVYQWTPVLEQCTGGTISTLGTGNTQASRQSALRLRVQGTAVAMTHGGQTVTANVAAESSPSARAYGMGYGDTRYDDNRYDNFTIDTLNSPPGVATPSAPANGATADVGSTLRLAWVFGDPDGGDTQSKYDLRYRKQGTTDWTTASASTPNTYRDFPANTFDTSTWEWQVLVYDAGGLPASAYSASSFFTGAIAPAAPIILEPAAGPAPQEHLLKWSAPAQDAYHVQTVEVGGSNDGGILTDSSTVESATTRERTIRHEVNGRDENTRVRIRVSGLWSQWATVHTPVSYTPPAAPGVQLVVQNAIGALTVIIDNPAPTGSQPAVASNEIAVDDGYGEGLTKRVEGLGEDAQWIYDLPRHGFDYEQHIQVTAIGTNGTTSSTLAPVTAG